MLQKLRHHIDPSDPLKADLRVEMERPTIAIPESFDDEAANALFVLPAHLTIATDWTGMQVSVTCHFVFLQSTLTRPIPHHNTWRAIISKHAHSLQLKFTSRKLL